MIKLEIKENSKEADIVEVESYNAEETYKKMMAKNENGNRLNEFMVFGNNIYSTINIQSIKIIEETDELTPIEPSEESPEQLPVEPEEELLDE